MSPPTPSIGIVIHRRAEEVHDYYRRASLVYTDPCFGTGGDFLMVNEVAFSDRFTRRQHLEYLGSLLAHCATMLAPHGSLVVHCDPTFSHVVRARLDAIFGHEGFCDEVVWRYRHWATKANRTQRVHDCLIRYAHHPKETRWNPEYEPLAPSTVKAFGTKRQKAIVRDGVRRKSIATDVESPGVPIGDVWEMPIVAPMARERTGYPTQKPKVLLRRVVSLWSNPGDLVIDPTCGSGTTLEAAAELGRQWVGIDSSPVAVRVSRERLSAMMLDERRSA